MARNISLRTYVKRRNGVPLGAPGSLQKMLHRSLGAGSFALFWRYWNPIWSYYLSKYVMRPASKVLPTSLAVIVTFIVSGAAHDLAVTLISRDATFLITPWFFIMGVIVVINEMFRVSYHQFPWFVRALFNSSIIIASFALTSLLWI